jgi:hypothetical protein
MNSFLPKKALPRRLEVLVEELKSWFLFWASFWMEVPPCCPSHPEEGVKGLSQREPASHLL